MTKTLADSGYGGLVGAIDKKDENEKRRKLDEVDGEDVDIDQDVYGATIFSVIYDLAEIFSGTDTDDIGCFMNLMRLVFVLLTLTANFTLQISMLYWIYTYVVLTTVHTAEFIYQKYHAECFRRGQFSPELWEAWEWKEELCGMGFANFGFMFSVLTLWWVTMLNEFRKNEQLLGTLVQIRSTENLAEMVAVGEDGFVRFRKLTSQVRWTLYMVLVVPKFAIGIGLLLIGTIWLTATDSYGELILNAIALEFVIQVDELLFSAMMPTFICERIEETKFVMPAHGEQTVTQTRQVFYKGYMRSFIYFFGVGILVCVFLTYGQQLPIVGVFPGFDHDVASCDAYFEETTRRICVAGEICFPKA